jgi:hypothetical protein
LLKAVAIDSMSDTVYLLTRLGRRLASSTREPAPPAPPAPSATVAPALRLARGTTPGTRIATAADLAALRAYATDRPMPPPPTAPKVVARVPVTASSTTRVTVPLGVRRLRHAP